jgi:hypothetical protein
MISGPKICTVFKRDLLRGCHAFDRDQFALALYTASAPLDPDETASYSSQGEVVAPGYTAGGQLLQHPQLLSMGGICFVTFDDPVWEGSTIVARAALVYNYSAQNRAVAILDFGSDQRSNQGSFHVQFPPPGPTTALIRIA